MQLTMDQQTSLIYSLTAATVKIKKLNSNFLPIKSTHRFRTTGKPLRAH